MRRRMKKDLRGYQSKLQERQGQGHKVLEAKLGHLWMRMLPTIARLPKRAKI